MAESIGFLSQADWNVGKVDHPSSKFYNNRGYAKFDKNVENGIKNAAFAATSAVIVHCVKLKVLANFFFDFSERGIINSAASAADLAKQCRKKEPQLLLG